MTPIILIYAELRAPDAYAGQDVQNEGEELDVIDGARKTKMAEMSRALVIRLTATPTLLSIINHSHSWVKEAPNLWLVALVGPRISNLDYRALFNLIGTEYAKLNANNWFNF
jgi:hypothetical protein